MRKIFIFLMTILVCGVPVSAVMGTPEISTKAAAESRTETVSPASVEDSSISFSAAEVHEKIVAARELLRSQPGIQGLSTVRLALFDPDSSQTDLLSLPKDSFLLKNADIQATTAKGRTVQLRVIRANGVNTAVTLTDAATKDVLLPLVVEFPIEKNGGLKETAYYSSAHPALVSPAVIASGQAYITSMLDQAAQTLAEKGVSIDPEIITIAQHLVIVEHTDHQRFLNEDRTVLFPEILSLYALNQGDTFNYSVSTAGAGGMIQMIPRTYEAIRQQHPGIGLEPDFVSGMRNHANALEAMLLYMNDTWRKLQESPEVQDALRNGVATKAELLAAGYNSNPLRLPTYLKNGPATWRSLIPAETQMYLAIYAAVDTNVNFSNGTTSNSSPVLATSGMSAERALMSVLFSWMRVGLLG